MKYFFAKTGDYDECEWTGWLDQDNPSGRDEFELEFSGSSEPEL